MNKKTVMQIYEEELFSLLDTIRDRAEDIPLILPQLSRLKDTAKFLKSKNVFRLLTCLDLIYKSIADRKIERGENLHELILIICDKVQDSFSGKVRDKEILRYIRFADKVSVGEIFETSELQNKTPKKAIETTEHVQKVMPPSLSATVPVPLVEVNDTLNAYETMLAHTYHIESELLELPADSKSREIMNGVHLLRQRIAKLHTTLLSVVKDDDFFIQNHCDFHGFFVLANQKKYFISAEFIADITYENELEYVTEHGQTYLRRDEINEFGEEEETLIPVYSLSSVFPEQNEIERSAVDAILIAEYQNQRVGIMVENVQTFSSLVKKQLPPSFAKFSILEGVVFDEKYSMIPILYVPEIMKRFRAQRPYDIKKFQTNTRKKTYRILVVDDSETTRQVVHTALVANGFAVEEAFDGIKAIEFLKNRHFDLVVTDDEMPRMTGEILIDNIRHSEKYNNTPVIALSANPIEGANDFVCKSDFQRNNLIQKIKELLYE